MSADEYRALGRSCADNKPWRAEYLTGCLTAPSRRQRANRLRPGEPFGADGGHMATAASAKFNNGVSQDGSH